MIKEFDMSLEELNNSCEEMRKELFNLKMQLSFSQTKESAKIRKLRRAIARAKTIIQIKKRGKSE